MHIGVPREIVPGEKRVALVPEVVAKLIKDGHAVSVETGAGDQAGFSDSGYAGAGATMVADATALFASSNLILKLRAPIFNEAFGTHEVDLLAPGSSLIAFLNPRGDADTLHLLAGRGVNAFAMELVPRSTRAQMMDALSSQSTVAGYKAALLAANAVGRFFPLLMTAAGTIRPAKVLVIGAGVAGLQAIATARRLGAVVEAFDTRPVVEEQVRSLGAGFVKLDVDDHAAQDAGGYARELSADHIRREQELIHTHATQADAVITTALVPGKRAPLLISEDTVRAMKPGSAVVDLAGKRAPLLISEDTVRAMKPGSAVVDLAAEQGGNCELSVAGQTIVKHRVTIIAPENLTSELAFDASAMYSRNVAALVRHLAPKGELVLDFADDITRAVCVTTGGEVVLDRPAPAAFPTEPAPRPQEARV